MNSLLKTVIPVFLLFQVSMYSQEPTELDYSKIYSHCLDGNVKAALPLLDVDLSTLSAKDVEFKKAFEERFKGAIDSSDYLKAKTSKIHDLHLKFRDYWRKYLLDPNPSHERSHGMNAIRFLKENYAEVKNKTIKPDSLGFYLSQYIKSKGYYTTSTANKTGALYDLLVWRSQRDTVYSFNIKREKIETRVVFMNDFVTLGWEEYATLGRYYPGGWATNDAIYCVEEAYDLESESFKISYLAHEGRHFLDYKSFPNLDSADLEYRAKLSELSLAEATLFKLIERFMGNSNGESDNPHPLANYHVIQNLSQALFNTDFERDMSKWKTLKPKKIHKAAYKLLQQNTSDLNKAGKNVESLIKTL